MSSCLIFQRPDICSTTSLESIRTSTSRPGRSRARPRARRPARSTPPRCCVAVPMDSARSASTSPVSRVAHERAVRRRPGVAARAAVGLDDEARRLTARPDSAVRTRIRRHSSQRSTSSRRRARMPAISTAFELEPAALAPALVQPGRAHAAVVGADLLVRAVRSSGGPGDQSARCARHELAVLGVDARRARRRASSMTASTRDCELGTARARERGERGAAASSSRSMTSSSTSSSSDWRRASDASSCCRFSQLLGRGHRAGVQRLAGRARRAARTCSTSESALACSRATSLSSVSARDDLVAQRRRGAPRARRARRARAASRAGGRAGRAWCRAPARRAGAAGRRARRSGPAPSGVLGCRCAIRSAASSRGR